MKCAPTRRPFRRANWTFSASKGYRNNEIARLSGISVNTLKYHLKNAFDKLGVTSRTEAVTEAIHRGIIES